ncbi:MAG: hypothetical protein KatS3mg095_0859 [Candidatus Parcubacteria bacterium]|nr:MAG: hypothetical protein KatS3mg095_0859 [Candidatus Parcubacteria bacterium]
MKKPDEVIDNSKIIKELVGKEVLFFKDTENFRIYENIFEIEFLDKHRIQRIKPNYVLLRKYPEEDVTIDREVDLIEVLTLNFPENQEYKFSFEEWKMLWLKYGGWIPPDLNPPSQYLSIKEAREFFSKLPSKTEVIFDYYFSPNEYLYDFCKYKSEISLERYIRFLNINLQYFNYNILNIDIDRERIIAKKRYQIFGRPIPLEILNINEWNYILNLSNNNLIQEYCRKSSYRSIKPELTSPEFENVEGTTSHRYREIINPGFYPYHIFYNNPTEEDLKTYIKIYIIRYLRSISQETIDENLIIYNLLFNYQFSKLLKYKHKIILLPTVAAIPSAIFFKWLLRYTKNELTKKNRKDLAEKIFIPRFIFINTSSRYLRRNILINGELNYEIFNNLKNDLINKSLEEQKELIEKQIKSIEEQIKSIKNKKYKTEKEREEAEKERESLNFLKNILENSLNLKRRFEVVFKKIFHDINIYNLSEKLQLLRLSFLDDAIGSKATYFFSYIISYFALLDIFKDKLKSNWNEVSEQIYSFLDNQMFPLSPRLNISEFDYLDTEETNRLIFTKRIFIELLPLFKVRKEDSKFTIQRIIKTTSENEPAYIFNNRKVDILKEIAKYLSPLMAEYIIRYPELVY